MKLPLLLTSLADSATHHPNDIAITSDTTAWSYAMLWNQIARFESKLANLALPPGVAVAVTAHKGVDTLALMLALVHRGHTLLAVGASQKPRPPRRCSHN
jgi:acyl-CoA synthetase (AMP-forming)/AMP-acid ligase II